MKTIIHRINNDPKYARVFYWGKLVTITGSGQIIVQAIGLVCGILVIRLLSPAQYALYTLANTMLGTMLVLADGGISTGVMSQAGKVWTDKDRLGTILSTGFDLRKKFAIGSLIIAVPLLIYLLMQHGAGWQVALVIVLALIPAYFTSLSGTLLEIIPKLHQDILPLQKIQVGSNIARLFLLFLSVFIFPWAFVAILAAGIPQIWANKRLRNLSVTRASLHQAPDPEVRKNILVIVKRVLPGAIYYCMSGQITIWLISVFGSTTAVAQAGALGRIAMLLTLFSVLFSTLVIPRFARLPADKSLMLKRFLQIHAGLILLGLIIVGLVYLFSSSALWILGKNYQNLQYEFLLNIIGSFIGLTAGTIFSMNISRGWTINPLISIPLNLLAITCGLLFIDISSLKGIFYLNIFILSTELVIFSFYGLLKISKTQTVPEFEGQHQ